MAALATATCASAGWGGPTLAPAAGIAWRVGAILAVVWLAYDQIRRLPTWIVLTIPPLVLLAAVRPKWLIWAAPIVLLIILLRPRGDRGVGDGGH